MSLFLEMVKNEKHSFLDRFSVVCEGKLNILFFYKIFKKNYGKLVEPNPPVSRSVEDNSSGFSIILTKIGQREG